MRTKRVAAATITCVLAASAAALADSRIEFKVTEGSGTAFQSILIGQGKIRQDADKTTSAILDPGGGTITVLDHTRKTYMRLTRADIDQLSNTLDDWTKQMEQPMNPLPASMQERMKGLMGAGAGSVEVVDTGQSGTVAGRSCRIFQTKVLAKVFTESCMADPSVIELPASDGATVASAVAWAREIGEKLMKGPLAAVGTAFPFRGGLVPLRSTIVASDGSRSTSEFTGVTNADAPADSFAVPAGYAEKKIELPKGRGGGPARY
jgi:hypothetical protein